MSYDLLIETKKEWDTVSVHLLHELLLANVVSEGTEVGVAALISIDGVEGDVVAAFAEELKRDRSLIVSKYDPDGMDGRSFTVLSHRIGAFLPNADIAYKQILLRDPELSDDLRISEYALFYTRGANAAREIKAVENYMVDMGDYRHLTIKELVKCGLPIRTFGKGENRASLQPPSLAPKENPALSEPFSTTRSKMVMDRYRNITRDEMKSMAVLSSRSGNVAEFNNTEYLGLVKRLQDVGINMSIDDAKDAQSYFRMESREPTEMELRIITRCRSERWAHPALHTTINFSEFNDDAVYKSIASFMALCEKMNISTDNVTLADIVNAPLRYFSNADFSEDERMRDIEAEQIFSMEDGNHGLLLETAAGRRKLAVTLESNNTKTSVDPAGGAMACLGISLRRALGMEQHPYDVIRLSGIASPFADDGAPENVRNEAAEQRRLAVSSLDSFSEYARTAGVPCSGNFEYTSDRFTYKHMEVSAALSVSEEKDKNSEAYYDPTVADREKDIAKGDTIVIFGNRTGRDGRVYRRYLKIIDEKLEKKGAISENEGGAMEARIRSELVKLENGIIADNIELMGEAVPRGDARLQKKLMRICSDPAFTQKVKSVCDVDSSGIVTAVTALGMGADVYLDCVPVKYNDMSSTDVAFSETCERMIAVVDRNNVDGVIELCAEYGVICSRIGFVTANRDEDSLLRVYGGGKLLAELSLDLLINNENNRYITAEVNAPAELAESPVLEIANAPYKKMGLIDRLRFRHAADHLSAYKKVAADCKIKADTRKRRFDNTFFASTGISHMNRGFAPVSVSYIRDSKGQLFTKKGKKLCTAVTVGMHPEVCNADPYKGAYYAMTDTLSRLIAAGVPRSNAYAALHLFHPAYRSDAKQNGDALAAVAGLYEAQMKLGYPIVCGDYSLGGVNSDEAKPAVAVFGVSVGEEASFRYSGFKKAGNKLCVLKPIIGKDGVPDPESQIAVFDKVEALIAEGRAVSAMALTGMCLAEGVMYMCFGADGECGFEFDDDCGTEDIYSLLYGAIAVELEDVRDMPKATVFGTVTDTPAITLKYNGSDADSIETEAEEGIYGVEKVEMVGDRISLSVPYLKKLSRAALASVYEIAPYPEIRAGGRSTLQKLSALDAEPRRAHYCLYDTAKPVILVPCFTSSVGAEGLIDALRKEELASQVEIKRLDCRIDSESAEELAEAIKQAQMLCLPDLAESPSLLAAILKYPAVETAIATLRGKKGLIYGCGAAFAALIQAGYIGSDLNFGSIEELAIAPNPLSGLTRTPTLVSIVSDDTPFLNAAKKGTLYRTEVSSYSGRLVGNRDHLNAACVNGVISTVYAEDKKEQGMRFRYNPCNSVFRIDSMTSADGLILGQLSFPERANYHAGRGFEGYAPLPIFKSAINYLLHRQENNGSGSVS